MSNVVAAATQRQGACTLSKNAVVVQRPDMESELESSDELGEIHMVLGLFGGRQECTCHSG